MSGLYKAARRRPAPRWAGWDKHPEQRRAARRVVREAARLGEKFTMGVLAELAKKLAAGRGWDSVAVDLTGGDIHLGPAQAVLMLVESKTAKRQVSQ